MEPRERDEDGRSRPRGVPCPDRTIALRSVRRDHGTRPRSRCGLRMEKAPRFADLLRRGADGASIPAFSGLSVSAIIHLLKHQIPPEEVFAWQSASRRKPCTA